MDGANQQEVGITSQHDSHEFFSQEDARNNSNQQEISALFCSIGGKEKTKVVVQHL
jgi:hypothetical protein